MLIKYEILKEDWWQKEIKVGAKAGFTYTKVSNYNTQPMTASTGHLVT